MNKLVCVLILFSQVYSVISLLLNNKIEKLGVKLLNCKEKYSIPALITPMKSDLSIDYDKFEQLIDFHLDKSDSLTILGSTGEWSSIVEHERNKLIKIASNTINGRFPLIVGTGDINTDKTILNCLEAEKYGADINLIISPFYTRPSQNGIIDNYNYISKNTNLPIIIYDCPSRTSSEMTIDTITVLSFNEKIIGIKDASGNIDKLIELKKYCDPNFIFLSGDDITSYNYCRNGGNGCITVLGNILPSFYKKIIKLSEENSNLSNSYFNQIIPIIESLNCQTNPIPIKYATYKKMNLEGIWSDINYGIRRPLHQLSEIEKNNLDNILTHTNN